MNAALTTLWTVLVPLTQQTPDPEDVKPGWLGFGVFLLLVAAVVVLAFSFRKQLKKVNFPENGPRRDAEGADDAGADDGAGDGSGDDAGPGDGADRSG